MNENADKKNWVKGTDQTLSWTNYLEKSYNYPIRNQQVLFSSFPFNFIKVMHS